MAISWGISDSNTGGSPANPHTGVSVSGVWGPTSSDVIGTLSSRRCGGKLDIQFLRRRPKCEYPGP